MRHVEIHAAFTGRVGEKTHAERLAPQEPKRLRGVGIENGFLLFDRVKAQHLDRRQLTVGKERLRYAAARLFEHDAQTVVAQDLRPKRLLEQRKVQRARDRERRRHVGDLLVQTVFEHIDHRLL